MKGKTTKAFLLLLLIASPFMCSSQSWALSKGALTAEELDYFYNTFTPILIKAHICNEIHKDCAGMNNVICNSEETLSCTVYGVTDGKVIKELFMSMLSSGLKVSYFAFMRSKYHEGSFFEKPLLEFYDRTSSKLSSDLTAK